MSSTVEYLGPESITPVSSIPLGGVTITFAAAPRDCRRRWLWINAMGDNDATFPPVAPVLLQYLHVTAIRVNGGPNLVTGPIHLSCFQPTSDLTGGSPSREMNTTLFAGDVVTVTIADSNPAGGQVNTFYSAQIKTDSASSSSGANTVASTLGPQIYWLGSTAATNLTVTGNGSATWTSDAVPVDSFLSYWYQGTSDSSASGVFQDQLALTSLTVGAAVLNYVAGFPMIKPQDDLAASTICKGQELHLEVLAGESVTMVFANISGQDRVITVAWALTP